MKKTSIVIVACMMLLTSCSFLKSTQKEPENTVTSIFSDNASSQYDGFYESESSDESVLDDLLESVSKSDASSMTSSFVNFSSQSKKESSSGTSKAQSTSKASQGSTSSSFVKREEAKEMRGVWISYVDLGSKFGNSDAEFKTYIDGKLTAAKNARMNTVYFHVRPFGDALYPSSYYPVSHLLTGKQGDTLKLSFDPLEYVINKSHELGLELHAWINPLRVKVSNSTPPNFSADNPAVLHPDWTIESGILKFYDVTKKEVKDLVTNGVKEIVEKYNVDGIHFDDYFYREESGIDKDTYTKEVNILVKNIYSAVKAIKKDVVFGISPAGNPENAANSGADVKTWGSVAGYVDYLCPQIYWTDEYKLDSYKYSRVLQRWSSEIVKSSSVKLYVGLDLNKVGAAGLPPNDLGWDSGSKSILKDQVLKARTCGNYYGFIILSHSNFTKTEAQAAEIATLQEILKEEYNI